MNKPSKLFAREASAVAPTRTTTEPLLGCSLADIEGSFSEEDRRLQRWIACLNQEDLATLLSLLQGRWLNSSALRRWCRAVGTGRPSLDGAHQASRPITGAEQESGATLIVQELRRYAGHSLAFFRQKPHYEEIVARVHERLARKFKQEAPAPDTPVVVRERAMTELLAAQALDLLTASQLASAVGSWEAPDDLKRNPKPFLKQALATEGIAGLERIAGRQGLKKILLRALRDNLLKKLSKKVAYQVFKAAVKKVPLKLFVRMFKVVGLALLLKDLINLGAEATRVTTPLVITIAMYRTLERTPSDPPVIREEAPA